MDVSFEYLFSLGVPFKTINSGTIRYRKGLSKNWENKKDIDDKRKVLINLDTIPDGTRKKYNIPTGAEYQVQLYEASRQKRIAYELEEERKKIEKRIDLEREIDIVNNSEKLALRNAYNNDWIQYVSLYKERYSSRQDCDKLASQSAKEHAFWLEMVEVTGGKWRGEFGKAGICFEYLQDLKKELVFSQNISNATYFRRKLKDLRDKLKLGKSIVDVIANNKIGERPEVHIYNDFHKGSILYYVGHEKKYSYRLCTDLINKHCEDEKQQPLNESYIKKVLQTDNEFRTLVFSRRNGSKYRKDMILPHASRYPVEFPANLWMIDGTPIQMYCKNANGNPIRLNLFIVLDVFSRKIVGFDIAYHEDKFMVMNAIKMAVQDEGHLPKEILSDNFSANKTEEIMAIKEQMLKMLVNWRLAKVGNPQDKAQVERAFGVLQSEIFAFFEDYFGEGIASRRDNRPNAEFLAKHTKNPLSVDAMKARICEVIALYNEQEKRTRKSPLELYKLPKPNAVEMDIVKTALMFWTRTKHTVIQAMVKITVNKIEHKYEIYSHKIKMQLQGKRVYVRYDVNDLDRVMLFDIDTESVICECKKQIKVYVESDKPKDNLMKHTAKVKSYDDHLNKQWDKTLQGMLDVTGKDQIDEYKPFDLAKNQIHLQESKDLLESHKRQTFGLTEDIHKPVPKPRKAIVKNNTTYEDGIVNKKSLVEASFKVVKPS